jgi:hypothetical protein
MRMCSSTRVPCGATRCTPSVSDRIRSERNITRYPRERFGEGRVMAKRLGDRTASGGSSPQLLERAVQDGEPHRLRRNRARSVRAGDARPCARRAAGQPGLLGRCLAPLQVLLHWCRCTGAAAPGRDRRTAPPLVLTASLCVTSNIRTATMRPSSPREDGRIVVLGGGAMQSAAAMSGARDRRTEHSSIRGGLRGALAAAV